MESSGRVLAVPGPPAELGRVCGGSGPDKARPAGPRSAEQEEGCRGLQGSSGRLKGSEEWASAGTRQGDMRDSWGVTERSVA